MTVADPRLSDAYLTPGSSSFADFLGAVAPDLLPSRRVLPPGSAADLSPHATTIVLEQNYRSTQRILRAANTVIAKNTGRRPKNLWTDAGDGELIEGYVADNEHDEAAWVAEYYPTESTSPRADGGMVATFRVTDPAWLRHLLLRLGGAATVLAPAGAGEDAAQAAEEALAAYADLGRV